MDTAAYFKEKFIFDLKAGFITAVVALPLALGFAIASGVPPVMGLYTAVIAGILGSLLGGSPFSITGPTGAMTVLILGAVSRYGIEGLLLTGFIAGLIQIGFALLKVGRLVKFLPFPIISGFTAGIGAIIFSGQIANAFGLIIKPEEHIWQTFYSIFEHLSETNFVSVGITIGTLLILLFLPSLLARLKWTRNIPPSIIALVFFTVLAVYLGWKVPVIGDIPSGFPLFQFFPIDFHLALTLFSAGLSIALLGMIEALLCAVVCDGMTNTKHNSNKELLSQGVVNVIVPFFGGMPATAAVARSAVNIREGARTRWAGVYHGLFLLLTLLFFAPVAKLVPKAFLAGVLMFVSARMISIEEFKVVYKLNKEDFLVMVATFLLTILTDLVIAVQVGFILAVFMLFVRLTKTVNVSTMEEYSKDAGLNALILRDPGIREAVSIYTIHGPFFFGAMNLFDHKIDEHMKMGKKFIVLRMKHVSFIDSTGVLRIVTFLKDREKQNRLVFITGLQDKVRDVLFKDHEFKRLMVLPSEKRIFNHTSDVLDVIKKNYLQQ